MENLSDSEKQTMIDSGVYDKNGELTKDFIAFWKEHDAYIVNLEIEKNFIAEHNVHVANSEIEKENNDDNKYCTIKSFNND